MNFRGYRGYKNTPLPSPLKKFRLLPDQSCTRPQRKWLIVMQEYENIVKHKLQEFNVENF